jgi:anti-sigma-K factor RskA
MTMQDDALHDLAVRYVLGELPPPEATAFERRLAGEPALAADVERLARTYAMVGMSAATAPPPELRARVLGGEAARPRRRFPRPALSHLVTAMAATMAIVFGVDGWRARRELDLQRSLTAALQEPNVVRTFAMGGTDAGEGAVGRVALDLDAQKGALVMRRLPALPDDHVYRLWAAVGERAVPCGDFTVAANGEALAQFRVPVESYTAPIRRLFVTVEPAGPGDVPTGPTVMQSV